MNDVLPGRSFYFTYVIVTDVVIINSTGPLTLKEIPEKLFVNKTINITYMIYLHYI